MPWSAIGLHWYYWGIYPDDGDSSNLFWHFATLQQCFRASDPRKSVILKLSREVTPSATARLHNTATHAVSSTTETPEHHFAAVANTITPEDGRIRPKHVELFNT
jgi:hypothetical protein